MRVIKSQGEFRLMTLDYLNEKICKLNARHLKGKLPKELKVEADKVLCCT